MALAVQ